MTMHWKYREGVKFGLPDKEAENFVETLRRLQQARDAFESSAESEDFQAVGMRCREAFLALVRECAKLGRVTEGSGPKQGDFINWIELIANDAARGASAERLRGYIKATSRANWELVQWLTHARNSRRDDAHIALDATQTLCLIVVRIMNRWLHGEPWRCPACGSYDLDARPRDPDSIKYELFCVTCGWGGRLAEPDTNSAE
jgi:hypothetical protein